MAWEINSKGYTYPLNKMNFVVSVDGATGALPFSEVTGVDATVDVIEFRQGNAAFVSPVKLPGLVKHGNITLKFGTVANSGDEVFKWMCACVSDERKEFRRAKVTIQLLNSNDNLGSSSNGVLSSPATSGTLTWTLNDAWVCKMSVPDLDAKGNDIAISSVEIAYETMEFPVTA